MRGFFEGDVTPDKALPSCGRACQGYCYKLIRHINPVLFDVIDDKPEDVDRGVYHNNHERVCV